ncbi:MAG: hypothetical protein IJ043_11240 [Clostridia bacterium]|nr:hypothetical protein [Clostridia bacterium]
MKRLLAVLCIGLLLLTGCGKIPAEPVEDDLDHTFRALLSGGEMELPEPLLISSLEELQTFERQWKVDLSIDLPDGDPYTEEFFQASALLLVYGECPYIPQAFWVERVVKEETRITVHAVNGAPPGGDEAFGNCLMGLELKKTDVEGCDFTVEFREQPVVMAY